jgi:hypothetical protein
MIGAEHPLGVFYQGLADRDGLTDAVPQLVEEI